MDWPVLALAAFCSAVGYSLGRFVERSDRRDEDAILGEYEREMEDYLDG